MDLWIVNGFCIKGYQRSSVTELHVNDGGDHSFKIGKKHIETKGLTQDEVEDVALKAIADFVSKSPAERRS